jgi:hypothetical protein
MRPLGSHSPGGVFACLQSPSICSGLWESRPSTRSPVDCPGNRLELWTSCSWTRRSCVSAVELGKCPCIADALLC